MGKKHIFKYKTVVFVIFILSIICFLVITGLFYFFIKDTGESYSITKKWNKYYNLYNWNLNSHAIDDFDGDGIKDLITFDGCSFFSSIDEEDIPKAERCIRGNMSPLVFGDKEKVGQSIYITRPPILFKSFIVKNKDDKIQFYAYDGFRLIKKQLSSNKSFEEVRPDILDYIDFYWYSISHLGVVLVMLVMYIMSTVVSIIYNLLYKS